MYRATDATGNSTDLFLLPLNVLIHDLFTVLWLIFSNPSGWVGANLVKPFSLDKKYREIYIL